MRGKYLTALLITAVLALLPVVGCQQKSSQNPNVRRE